MLRKYEIWGCDPAEVNSKLFLVAAGNYGSCRRCILFALDEQDAINSVGESGLFGGVDREDVHVLELDPRCVNEIF